MYVTAMLSVFSCNINLYFQIERWIWQQVTWVTREQRHQQVEDRGANCREMTTGLFATDSLSSLMSDYLHHLSRPRCPMPNTMNPLWLRSSTINNIAIEFEHWVSRSSSMFQYFRSGKKGKTHYLCFSSSHKNGKHGIYLAEDRECMGCWGLRVESKREQSVREQQLDNWTTGQLGRRRTINRSQLLRARASPGSDRPGARLQRLLVGH